MSHMAAILHSRKNVNSILIAIRYSLSVGGKQKLSGYCSTAIKKKNVIIQQFREFAAIFYVMLHSNLQFK